MYKLPFLLPHNNSDDLFVKVKAAVKKLKAEFVFVAADNDHMLSQFKKAMKKVKRQKQMQNEMYE